MEIILKKAKKIANQLLNNKPIENTRKIPEIQGVYLIYNKNQIIYAGKGKNLNRRINSDHISGERRGSTSIFRKKIHEIYGIPFGKLMRKWVIDNCKFAYKEIKDKDMCSLVEVILIAYFRKKNPKLLND
ncbi:MAG: GIY-YIG nuclease family protein [Candidatus Nealsonbacteria bacterium]